jgi:hypothetical protein
MVDLDIVNRALTFLGAHMAGSMADVDKNAARAIAAYEECRDEVLRMERWTCCLKRSLMKDCGEQATPWQASHTYGVGERVTNDTLKTYTCTTAGKSAAAGGPTGVGSEIADGTAEWDYVEASTALNNWCHAVSTPYEVGDLVSWDTGKIYACIQAGTSAAANPPVGTSEDIVDGTVRWTYYCTIRPNQTIYSYQFVLPFDCLRVLKVPLSTAASEATQGVQYMIEGRFLFCDQIDSFLLYVYNAPVDQWDALLRGAVAFRIAAEIAFDVTGQKEVQQTAFAALGSQYAGARQISLNETYEGTAEKIRWEEV